MMQLFLEAVDVWLFRDGRPFDAFADHRARSRFPPYPSVMQGVIRSHHLVVRGVDLRDQKAIEAAVGTANHYGALQMRGPFVAKKCGQVLARYFPVPADAAREQDGYRALSARARNHEGVLTSAHPDLPMLLWPQGETTKEDFGQWLTEQELLRCLNGEAVCAVRSGDLYVCESRFGIGRNDDRRTTEEGALYEAEFIRPCQNVGLYVEVEGYEAWPAQGLMRIGGEGRGAYFTQLNATPATPRQSGSLPSRFKVYFASPTYFDDGWRPRDWGKFFDGKVQLKAVALNRYESIGGFDWAKGDQKPARRYVPAGSVYYFKHEGSARLKPGLTQNGISDLGAEVGFGQIIIPETEWKEC
jgi:CRISPR-associated protein Cmr3